MARLSIDIGVNLGDTTKQLGKLNASLIEISSNADKLVSSLKSLGSIKATAQVTTKFNESVQNVSQPNIQQIPDIFGDYRSGAIQASTAIEFLEKKQAELLFTSSKLKDELGRAIGAEQYQKLQVELNKTEKELNDVTRAIQSQKTPVGGTAAAYSTLTKSSNLANLSVINFGRVLQDLPFGILGIANNLNPLIEGMNQLKREAAAAGTTISQQLLVSLKGFGGITLAVSAVSAALSFAAVGLQYWIKGSKGAAESNEELSKSADIVADSYERMTAELRMGIESRKGYEVQKNILNTQLKLGRELTEEEKIREKIRGLTQALSDVTESRKALKANEEITTAQFGRLQAAEGLNSESQQYLKLQKESEEQSKLNKLSSQEIANLTEEIYLAQLELFNLEKGIGKEKDKNKKKEQTAADIYKEINDDLKKFQSLRNIDFLEKTNKSTDRINSGLDEVVDKFGTLRINDAEFKKLEQKLDAFKEVQIRLEISQIKQDLESVLNSLKQKASFFNIDTTKDQIKEVENAIDKLYQKFQDKKVSPFEKQDIFLFIGILESRLKELKLDEIFNKGKESFKEFNQDLKKLETKGLLLNISTIREQFNLVKKSVDDLIERKIELVSSGDISRATILNILLNNIKKLLPSIQVKLIREEYDKDISRLEGEKRTLLFGVDLDDVDFSSNLNRQLEKVRQEINITKTAIDESLKLGALDSNFKTYTDNLEKFLKEYSSLFQKIKVAEQLKNAADALNNALTEIISTIANTLAEGIGTALAGGDIDNLFKEGLKNIATTIKDAGKQLTAIASAVAVFKANLFKNPIAAIAAGIGLTILGSFLETKLGFATGGFVSGPGSERSDSIPARLSNGEFVVQARSVRKYGRGFMEMLNSGNLPITNYRKNFSNLRFADGGLVDSLRQFGRNGGSSKALVNRSDFGNDMGGFIAETKISGQDLRLVLKRADNRFKNAT